MGGKSQPDMSQAAVQQGEINKEAVEAQTYANRPDQYTPWGYTKWTDTTDDAGNIRWSQTQGLTPELQRALNQQIAQQGARSELAYGLTQRMGDEFGSPMNYGGLNPYAKGPEQQYTAPESMQRSMNFNDIPGVGDPTALRGRAEDAVYNKGASRLSPRFAEQRRAMEVKMRNQGLGPEDAAWKAQMATIGQQETDAFGQLQSDAITHGLGEQSQLWNQGMGARQQAVGERQSSSAFRNQAANQAFNQMLAANQQNFGQGMQSANYANQLRQSQLAEMMQRRGQSLNEINAMMSGQQVQNPQMPSFSQAGQAQPAPIYTAAADQASINNANNPWNALIGAYSWRRLYGKVRSTHGIPNRPRRIYADVRATGPGWGYGEPIRRRS